MPEEPLDPVVRKALDAIERRHWKRLEPLLHPYLHWTDASGTLRGRRNVLAHLLNVAASRPDRYELRDGQIYRWSAVRSR
jgi:hypothetical protein